MEFCFRSYSFTLLTEYHITCIHYELWTKVNDFSTVVSIPQSLWRFSRAIRCNINFVFIVLRYYNIYLAAAAVYSDKNIIHNIMMYMEV